ncbi:MAG: hypothetical protein IRY85_00315 [Micromonosporaceae bacterium]|nr:hypothetical protein [Micromonosporaceae bacterium]
MTEIGFVSLLVAGFGALAGALAYLGVRFATHSAAGRPVGRAHDAGQGRP